MIVSLTKNIFPIFFGFILIVTILNLILILIYLIIRIFNFLLNVPWTELKSKFKKVNYYFKKSFKEFQDLNFHTYLDLGNIGLLILFTIFKVNYAFLYFYIPFYLVTRAFIATVRDVILRSEEKVLTSFCKEKKVTELSVEKGISEFWFFVYIGMFILIIIAYITSFSLLYSQTFVLNYGQMVTSSGNKLLLNNMQSFYYSAYTFFGMEYFDVNPTGILNLFTIIEVFISQILLITFIGVMASQLISKLNLKRNGDKNE